MPSFSDSFWTSGYAAGLGVLFEKLHQGCVENDEVLTLAAARAEAEEQYGAKLQDIQLSYAPKKQGFARDDGASLRKAYEGIVSEMADEGRHHVQVAENIRRMVLVPFGKWADEHRQRVDYSHTTLKNKLKSYEKELSEVQKNQKRYFNKCRLLEDLRESEGAEGSPDSPAMSQQNATIAGANAAASVQGKISSDESRVASSSSTAPSSVQATPVMEEQVAESIDILTDPVELGETIYSPDEAAILFQKLLDEIPQKSLKVAILGTYEHVSSGDEIVLWIQQHITKGSLPKAEQFGQGLINSGYLRLVGQVGSKFANSSVMNYQWRKKAFVQAGRMPADSSSSSRDLIAPLGGYLGGTINNYINNPHPDESPEERLTREVKELDHRYRVTVQRCDDLRCNLEESIIDHLKFMERCETDRLKALKAVFLDFLASLSNVVPSIQAAIDKELIFQEAINPLGDLRYILESYRTGPFAPKVTIYDNYYNSTEGQTFGVDLELRSRGDKKRVPFIVSSILSHLDSQYPDLENDEVRLGTWTVSVPLNSTHRLRRSLNTGKPFSKEILHEFQAPIVASVLKLYLVELPDSVVPSQFYDIFKTIYAQHGNDEDPRQRLSAIQNTFAQFRLSNVATLDAICTHLTRLISITQATPEYISQLAQELSHCILRPRTQSSLTIGDRHAYRLVHDLLLHKEAIFRELKRNNSGASASTSRSGSARHAAVNASGNVRRASLQMRLDALSLKIRQSDRHGTKSEEAKVKQEPEGDDNTSENGVTKEPEFSTPPSGPSLSPHELHDPPAQGGQEPQPESQEPKKPKEPKEQEGSSQPASTEGGNDNPIIID
uniref:ARAD1B10450p n=1 Tax=Blastobotrys adeninivorans TaxID=409370 RepID=A0A060T6A9_BLAAD